MKNSLIALLMFVSVWAGAQEKRRIDVNWDSIPGAKSYEVELLQKTGRDLVSLGIFQVYTSAWVHEVVPGQYLARLRAVDRRNVPGEWSELFDIRIKLPSVNQLKPYQDEPLSEEEIFFQWSRVSGAISYLFVLVDGRNNILVQEQLTTTEHKVRLNEIATYRWVVIAQGEDPEDFNLRSLPANLWKNFRKVGTELSSPIVTVKIDGVVTVSWPEVILAKKYDVIFIPATLAKLKSKRFETNQTQFTWALTEVPDGVSTMTVTASAPDHKSSKPTLVKIIRDKERITSVLQAGGSEMRGWGDQFRRHWFQVLGSYGNGLYSATNQAADTKVNDTALGAIGGLIDYRFSAHTEALRHRLSSEFQSYQSGVSAQSISVLYDVGKSWRSRGRDFGLAIGAGVRQWPLLIPDRQKNNVESMNVTFLSPQVAGWWQDTLSERHTLRLELALQYNSPITKADGREVSAFASTVTRGVWQYYVSPSQAVLIGMQLQALKTDFKTEAGAKDKQELGLLSLLLGWGKGF